MPESRPRRTYLVDRAFQLKYILLLVGWGVVLAALFGLWAWQAHQQAVEIFARDAEQQALLRQVDRHLLWALAGIGLLSAVALGLLGFVMTHRVAGPVWVLSHQLSELARGRFPAPRALRRGDELQALHGRFQEAVAALAERDRRTVEALAGAAARLRPLAARDPEAAAVVAALEAEARGRGEALGGR